MARAAQSSRGTRVMVNLVGAAILVGALLTPGTQRLAGVGTDYVDQHPAVIGPLLAGLAVFVGAAIGLQSMWGGFVASATLGAVAGAALFLGLYAPARYALPYFGPDTASCPAAKVATADGTCAPKPPVKAKAAHR